MFVIVLDVVVFSKFRLTCVFKQYSCHFSEEVEANKDFESNFSIASCVIHSIYSSCY